MRVAIVSEVFLPKIDGVVNRTLNVAIPAFSVTLALDATIATDGCVVTALAAPINCPAA